MQTIDQPSADRPNITIGRILGETDMSLAQKEAPRREVVAGHRCIRWAMEDDSTRKSPRDMVFAILDSFAEAKSELILLFCSPQFHIAEIAAAVGEYGQQGRVVGCTTAGEITPLGHKRGSIVGVSFDSEHFAVSINPIEHLCDFEIAAGFAAARALLAEQELVQQRLETPHTFAMLINDGLAMREEAIVSAFGAALGHVPLVGGSAGTSPTVREPNMFLDGRVLDNAALMLLISTDHDFRVFQTQHFKPLELKVVVTKADPANRLVMEINAEPAAREYARLLGLQRNDLTPQVFAAHPLVVRAGGRHYARAIQQVNEDDSLHFFCAIDEGIVLSIAESGDLIADLESLFVRLKHDLGPVEAVLGFDCILRYIEMEQGQMLGDISRLLAANSVIGFNTYGEQFGTMHMSQTFTGIAFGAALGR
jgi:hypothetical protein